MARASNKSQHNVVLVHIPFQDRIRYRAPHFMVHMFLKVLRSTCSPQTVPLGRQELSPLGRVSDNLQATGLQPKELNHLDIDIGADIDNEHIDTGM